MLRAVPRGLTKRPHARRYFPQPHTKPNRKRHNLRTRYNSNTKKGSRLSFGDRQNLKLSRRFKRAARFISGISKREFSSAGLSFVCARGVRCGNAWGARFVVANSSGSDPAGGRRGGGAHEWRRDALTHTLLQSGTFFVFSSRSTSCTSHAFSRAAWCLQEVDGYARGPATFLLRTASTILGILISHCE